MLRHIALCTFCVILSGSAARSQPAQTLSVSPDSARWDLQGQAKAAEYQGRKCLFLDGGEAMLKGLEMRDGVIDVDVATPASRGFFGIQFRIASDGVNAEWVYLRQHKSGLPDALQYTPVLNTGLNWQIYNGPGFTGAIDIPKDVWFHLRLEVVGTQARLYVKDMDKPAPGFLGIVHPENDAVYLPLKKGRNDLMLAVSELGGGWGFICRLEDVEH